MEAYKIGISMMMTGNYAQVLGALSKGLLGVHANVKELESGFGRLRSVIEGAIGVFAGEKLLRGLVEITEKTKDLSHELTQIKRLGVDDADFNAARRQAQRVTERVRGVTETQALEIYGLGYSMFGANESLQIMDPLARFFVASGNTTGNYDVKQLQQMLRAADLTGQFTNPQTKQLDLERLQHFLDLGTRVQSVTHGAVGPQTWLGLAQQGAPALTHMSDEGLITEGILAQYLGGPRAGTALMSAYQQLVGGTMFKRNAEALQEIGMLKPGEWGVSGGHVMLSQEASKRMSETLGKDPLAFTDKLIEQMAAAGITDPDRQSDELYRIFGRQTTQRMFSDLMRNRNQIRAERGRAMGAMSTDASNATANSEDVEQNLHNLSAAWDNLLLAVAGPDSKIEITVIGNLTSAFEGLTKILRGFPVPVLEGIGVALAAIGTALVGGGIALILGANAPIVAFVSGLAAAVAAAAALVDWQSVGARISGALSSIANAISAFWDKLKSIAGALNPATPGQTNPVPDPIPGPMNYIPGAGGARLWPAVYTRGGAGQSIYSPSAGGGAAAAHAHAAAAHAHAAAAAAGGGGSYHYGESVGAGLKGSAYLQAQRARFAAELHNNPNLRAQLAGAISLEDDRHPLPVVESLMNRMAYAGGSLKHGLFGGFYGPVNRGRLPGAMGHLAHNPAEAAKMNAAIDQALAGSNILHGFTDQGLPTDPNGRWRGPHMMIGGDVFNDWGGGPGGHAGASRFREMQQARVSAEGGATQALAGLHGAALRAHFGHRGAGIPPAADKSVSVQTNVHLDGKVVARSTAKHLSNDLNRPAKGPRVPDYTAIRPLEI
jgi:uncharacterized membrane protein YphA (DoxX/SURF4 family)